MQDDGPEVGFCASSAPHSHPQRNTLSRAASCAPQQSGPRSWSPPNPQQHIAVSRSACSDGVWPFADANAEQSVNDAAGNVAGEQRNAHVASSFDISLKQIVHRHFLLSRQRQREYRAGRVWTTLASFKVSSKRSRGGGAKRGSTPAEMKKLIETEIAEWSGVVDKGKSRSA
jgi:hypothetical protein